MKKSRGNNSNASREKRSALPSLLLKGFHLFAVAHFVYGIWYDFTYVHFPKTTNMSNNFGGKFKYLTVLDEVGFHTFISFNS